MKNVLQNSGWSIDSHKLPAKTMDELIRKKNEFLEISFGEVENAFNVSLSEFDSEKIEYIELAKGITRSLLRYDDCSFLLAQSVWRELKETYGLASELKYISLPNPIIHLPSDTSEVGPKHKDGYNYINHFYTTWTPLNDCFHKPLSITEKTHRKNGFVLRQLRARIKFIDRAILSMKKTHYPDIRIGEFFVWHGSTDHEGLLNKTDFITVSLVLRFTSSPILFEGALACVDLEKFIPESNAINVKELAGKFILLFNKVNEYSKQNEFGKLPFSDLKIKVQNEIKCWDLSSDEAKRFSFVLALWAQRLDGKRNVSLFYLYSYLVSYDNFYVFHKCISAILNTYGREVVADFIQSTIEKDCSTQLLHVIESATQLHGAGLKEMKLIIPAHSELSNYKFN